MCDATRYHNRLGFKNVCCLILALLEDKTLTCVVLDGNNLIQNCVFELKSKYFASKVTSLMCCAKLCSFPLVSLQSKISMVEVTGVGHQASERLWRGLRRARIRRAHTAGSASGAQQDSRLLLSTLSHSDGSG